ncbi:MAG: cobyric acid synthase [Bacteroidales bacterium]|nr:cobyric acid synthase [Bacteroidales bacterium]
MSKPAHIKRPIMFVGTGSDVGKSIINTAFCRIFKQDDHHPAPFKAQNMSLNSYATHEGLEIGRAQAVQAEACGVSCRSDMNPVLLKPSNNLESQIVLNGKPIGSRSASDYFSSTDRYRLFDKVMQSYKRLENDYAPIVIEGAGSISELNLRDKDITNMHVAVATKAATYLIADIDKGGIFANIYGTLELLPLEERRLIKGIIINKFRGDPGLFETGKQKLENLTGVPVVGILPYFNDIHIEEEDSVVLENKKGASSAGKVNIAIVLLRHMSNFTDFDVLERTPGVHLYYAAYPDDLDNADIVIIPGSKNTISDMFYLRKRGLAKSIKKHHEAGKAVYGICGGYQMMGKSIADPYHVEGDIAFIPGLGILPVETTLSQEKTTEQCTFSFLGGSMECKGYEIHMGETNHQNGEPLCITDKNHNDGYFLNYKTWGTYIHGIFDNQEVINHILSENGTSGLQSTSFDYAAYKEEQYDKLAALVREHTDINYIYQTLME